MTDRSHLDWIKSRLTRDDLAKEAQVEEIKPEIRTGVDFPIRQRMLSEDERGMSMASIVVEWGYDVHEGSDGAFRGWLADNEVALAKALAAGGAHGVKYLGTYVVSVTTEKGSGRYRTLWGLAEFGRIEMLGSPDQVNSDFGRLMSQFMGYRATAPGSPSSTGIYQIAAEPASMDR